MTGRIITARHGRPNMPRDVIINARDYADWWAQYDESGLAPGEAPPQALIDIASQAKTVLSSTLPRAIETARMATLARRDVPADALFVEAPLPAPPFPDFIKMRPGQWGVVSRTLWIVGFAPDGVENHWQCWDRVAHIADHLAKIAEEGDVLLCAHGYLNWMIDRRLRKVGWHRADHVGSNHYWSWRAYEPAGYKETIGNAALAE